MNFLSKKIFFVFTICLFAVVFPRSVDAFQGEVDFKKITWTQAEQAAEEESKFIFVDVYRGESTSPEVQKLKERIYSDPDVASYFNEHFINVKMDMSTEAGRDFAPKLQMLMYPTLVFFGPNETQLQYGSIQKFENNPGGLLEMAKEAVQEGELLAAFNTSKVDFLQKVPFDTLKTIAEKQGKPIMVDFYTTWCRPCIQMDRKVFTQNKVADFYNENFVVAKYDAEEGEGIELSERFDIIGYPTYLFLNADGKQLLRVEGYTEADSMIIHGKDVLQNFDDAQSHSIDFEPSDKSWAEIKKQAAREEKLIFMDAYAVWCGPCKKMDREVFTQKKVADYFNQHFVNAKIDMEKGEGIELRKEYEIKAYPTYLYVNASGDVVHRTVGSSSADELIRNAENARSADQNLAVLKKHFENNPGDIDAAQQYLEALSVAYKSEEMNNVVEAYLSEQKKESLVEQHNWEMLQKYVRNADSPHFEYLADNRRMFFERYGKETVQEKIYQVFKEGAYAFISHNEKTGEAAFDREGFEQYTRKVKASGIEDAEAIIRYGEIFNYQQMRQWQEYAGAIDQGIAEGVIDPSAMLLYNYARFVDQHATDEQIYHRASEWAYWASQKPGVEESLKNYYWKLQADLLEKAGKIEKAASVRKKIDENKVKEAEEANPMKPLRIDG